jgi:hypothetical protein
MSSTVHLLNAPKCTFKVPTAFPPLLNLNEQQQQGNTHMLFKVRNKNTFTMLISKDDSLISTSSESDNDEHTPISILSILEKLV